MYPELANLLPEHRVRAFIRGYFYRLGTVLVLMLAVVVGISAALLYPTHAFLQNQILLQQQKLAQLSAGSASADEQVFEARLTALSANAARIQQLNASNSPNSVLKSVFAVAHPGIILRGFTFSPPSSKGPPTIGITGTADTRDNLHAYQTAFQNVSFVIAADLPVSAYASDKNIDFTITLTLATP